MRVLDKKEWNKSIFDLVKMYKEGKLSFDNAAQRSYEWSNTRKDNRQSALIDSIIRGLPIPPMYCNALFDVEHPKKRVFDFLDGKQRMMTLGRFLNDEFRLIGLDEFNFDEESEDDSESNNLANLNGKTFSELSEDVRHTIETYTLQVFYFENLTQDEVDFIFQRLNGGKPLSSIDLTRVRAKSLQQIKRLADHKLFSYILTDKSIERRTNEDVVMKTWVELYTEFPSFLTKDFRPAIEEAIFTDEQVAEMGKIFTRLNDTYSNVKAPNTKVSERTFRHIKPKTHLITLAYAAQHSINDGVSDEIFVNWVNHFYGNEKNGASISSAYNSSAKAGSSDPSAIEKRISAMMADYKKFIEENQPKTEETVTFEKHETNESEYHEVIVDVVDELNTDDSNNEQEHVDEQYNAESQ